MALMPADRKAELARRLKTQQAIADATGEDFTLVSHVIAGRRLTSPGAQKIMVYVAGVLGLPIQEAFPEAQVGAHEAKRDHHRAAT